MLEVDFLNHKMTLAVFVHWFNCFFLSHQVIYLVQESFAGFSNFTFGRIKLLAWSIVVEIVPVIFEGDKSVTFGKVLDSVIKM